MCVTLINNNCIETLYYMCLVLHSSYETCARLTGASAFMRIMREMITSASDINYALVSCAVRRSFFCRLDFSAQPLASAPTGLA